MKCQFIKENGQQCESNALRDDEFCFMHSSDPEIIKIRVKALSEGGKNSRKQYEPIQDEITIKETGDVVNLITKLIQEVRRDEIATKKASTIGYLLNIILRALEQSNVEEKLKNIEYAISNKPKED